MKKILALLLAMIMVLSLFAACAEDTVDPTDDTQSTQGSNDATEPSTDEPEVPAEYTYDSYTAVMPSNWNEFTYADNNDTQIMNYIVSSFFEYDYKFEDDVKYAEDGSINKDALVPGAYTTNYSAATALEDITSSVALSVL